MSKLESEIQSRIIAKIKDLLPGVQIFKGDTRYKQGTPDLIILYKDRWALLEVKTGPSARRQPNQTYYIETLNEMSYAAFIHPENEEDILNGLQRALQDKRPARLS